MIAWIQAHEVPTVQGNHDAWVCRNYYEGDALPNSRDEERGWVKYTAQQLSDSDIAFLDNLPQTLTFSMDDSAYGMTHLINQYDELELVSRYAFEQFRQERFAGAPYERLIIGHTHFQGIWHLDNELLWLNPGSVSYRRKGDPDKTAHYITIVNGRISLNRISYDRTPLFQASKLIPLGPFERETAVRMFA